MSEWFGQMLGFVAAAIGLVTVPDAAALAELLGRLAEARAGE